VSRPRLFLCNAQGPGTLTLDRRHVVTLAASGRSANVHIRVEDVSRAFHAAIKPRLLDLLELASYVYTADASTRRDGAWSDDDSSEPWSRDFRFVVGVRDLEFWSRHDVQEELTNLLSFLSDDSYAFEFVPQLASVPAQTYLELGQTPPWPFKGVERVVMFSGGLDSLSGAVQMAASNVPLFLVSHRPVASTSSRQHGLFQALRDRFPTVPMTHVPVWINKSEALGREHTQRTRSFLYSALGTIVADSVGAEGVRFFENGVVSLNLPIADEVLRARASRTTHPLALARMESLYRLVIDRHLTVDNPFFFKTKTEVLSLLAENGAAELIQHTCSCAHTGFSQTRSQWHCGTCSQCIDRRVAVVASGLEQYDPESDYVVDVFTGVREEGYELNVAVDYARHGLELDQMSPIHFSKHFSLELSRAARCFPRVSVAADDIVDLHKRHGASVRKVLAGLVAGEATRLINGSLPATSLLAAIAGNAHRSPTWARYADRIVAVLGAGLPSLCRKRRPPNEPELQILCDGLLRASGFELRREFPFMAWSSGATKPDWSDESSALWIELKYVRRRTDVGPIVEAIAADITKYGDNGRRTLFVVYDPGGLLIDKREFAQPITRHDGMMVRFLP
jgi:hypothetical protein